jgi:glutamyl-tRNA(Gln) amidotransferase subunit D
VGGAIHVLNTGGTISYAADGSGLTWSPESFLADIDVPARVVYRDVLRKASINLAPRDWETIGGAVHDALLGGADGVVVLHGTDTLAYTAAALSFLLQNLSVPVVLTGAMRRGGAPDSDGRQNLANALAVAAYGDVAEVCVVFSGDTDGRTGAILRGSRVRKRHSSALDAFASPNHPALGSVNGRAVRLGSARVPRAPRGEPRYAAGIDANVCLLRSHPGLTAETVAEALGRTDGGVIEGTGLGHVATEGGILDAIRRPGKPVVVVSTCWEGGVKLGSYDVDREILGVDTIIPGDDMTPEAALVKLMWVLARERAVDRVRTMIRESVAGELTPVGGD